MPNDGTGTAWDEANPGDSNQIGQGAREIRDVRKGVNIRAKKEHAIYVTSSGGGEHSSGSAKAYFQLAAPTTRPNAGPALTSADAGRIWVQHGSTGEARMTWCWSGTLWFPIRAMESSAWLQQRSAGDGGTFTAGAWRVRGGWTVLSSGAGGSEDAFVTIIGGGALNIIQLPAGRFRFYSSAPAFRVNNHQTQLVRTDSGGAVQAVLLEGTSEWSAQEANYCTSRSVIQGEIMFTASNPWYVQLQHQCGFTRATDGFGKAAGFGISEIYSIMQITRLETT